MKKHLLTGMVMLSSLLSAQQLISFESTEGFTLGSVHGQQGWKTGVIDGYDLATNNTALLVTNISNIDITNTQAFHDAHSLKLSLTGHNSIGNYDLLGGFYELSTPLDANNFTISFDVKLEKISTNDFFFQAVNTNASGTPFIYMIDFSFDGSIYALTDTGLGPDLEEVSSWTPDTWYRVRIEGKPTGVEYYLNDALIYTAPQLNTNNTTFNRIDFLHDNISDASCFIDRIAINNENALSVKETAEDNTGITLYPNPTTDLLRLSSKQKVKSVMILDMTGRRMNASVHADEVDVRHLPKGTYIITISTEKTTTSKKFTKK